MAENKKGFVLYCDMIHTIKKLPDEKAGILFKLILAYTNDENPVINDLLIELVFEPIKQQLKRDLQKYEQKKIQRSEAGKKSAEQRKATNVNETQQTLTTVESRSTNSTVKETDKDKDKGIVKDIVNVKDIIIITSKIDSDFWDSISDELKIKRIDLIKSELKNSEIWLKQFCQELKLSENEIKLFLDKFIFVAINNDAFKDSLSGIKRYFGNWLRKNIDTLKPPKQQQAR